MVTERVGDGLGNLFLDGENVGQLAVEAVRPKLAVIRRTHQLRTDAHAVTLAAQRSIEHMRDAELAADLAHAEFLIPERERRSARGDGQSVDAGQDIQDLFGHALGQIGVVRIRAEVGERQHRNRARIWRYGDHLDDGFGCRQWILHHAVRQHKLPDRSHRQRQEDDHDDHLIEALTMRGHAQEPGCSHHRQEGTGQPDNQPLDDHIGKAVSGEQQRGDLDQQPRQRKPRQRDTEHIASLEFGEEAHCGKLWVRPFARSTAASSANPGCAQNAW